MGQCGRLVALAVAAISLSAAQHSNPTAKPQQPRSTQAAGKAVQNVAPANDENAERARRARYEARCDARNEKRDSDLCAQWKAADAAADSAWWAARATWVSGISGVLVLIALGFAFEANRIARETANRQLRAYLCLRPLTMQQIVAGADRFTITVPVENAGQTPANRMEVQWAWRVSTGNLAPEFFDNVLAQHPLANEREHCIGPHQVKEIPYWVKITQDWREKIIAGEATFYFLGKIHYVDIFGKDQITEFFYRYTEELPNRLGQMHVHNCIG